MVYLLEPKEYKWVLYPSVPHALIDKRVQGIPLQQSDLPAETELKARFALPDICEPGSGFLFVSDRFRAALEELVPGCVAFLPLNLKAPPHMLTDKGYFFVDVLPRAQLIDWDRSPTGPRIVRAPDGRESRSLQGRRMTDPSVKFRPLTAETPPIWREADLDRPTVQYFPDKIDVFMRDELWEKLNVRFPKQLVATKLAL
ncbi:imm11 family protein [Bradyrhizobium sp.]|uniref:imm11 family protein n=1 Tax=Bradyrhizobium sp. TaxID=376 RepID=UPI0027347D5A|nr:DUF1629 domain-containing protein [Bradyrhizobium sp.]MDP3077403.1 hypothetical protein [Bradyrhizobium sp.]